MGALDPVRVEQLVVVDDDPVVNADHRPVADRVVVRLDTRMALGVVAHVQQHLAGLGGERDSCEEGARARPLLCDRDPAGARAIGVTDRVGAALGDAGEQGLSRQRPVDARRRTEAVSGDSAHVRRDCHRRPGRAA
jgi:hypothetical protein